MGEKMKYHMCRVKTDPEAGSYGDCLRTSVASILDFDKPELVPHFLHDNCSGEIAHKRLREWVLTAKNLVPFYMIFDGNTQRKEVLEHMQLLNKDVAFLLFGSTQDGDHVVICRSGKVIHDTAWIKSELKNPTSNGFWMVLVFVPAVLIE